MRGVTERPRGASRPAAKPQERPRGIYKKGRLRIDFDAYEVSVGGRLVHLMRREFELLRFFVQSPNRVFDRAQLLAQIWPGSKVNPRSLDTHIYRLRRCIELDPMHPAILVTVRGVGWKFSERALGDADGEAGIIGEARHDGERRQVAGQTDQRRKRKGDTCKQKEDADS